MSASGPVGTFGLMHWSGRQELESLQVNHQAPTLRYDDVPMWLQ